MTLLKLLSMLQSTGCLLSVTTRPGGGAMFLDRLGESECRRYDWNGDEPTEDVVREVFAALEGDMGACPPTQRDPLVEKLIR